MECYLLMGFDLSLYSKRELYDVYFYFAQIILFTHINVYKTSTNILNTTVPFLMQLNHKQQTNKTSLTNPLIQQFSSLTSRYFNDHPLNDLMNDNSSSQKKAKRKNLNGSLSTNTEYHEQELLLANGHFAMSTAMHKCIKALEIDQRLKFSR